MSILDVENVINDLEGHLFSLTDDDPYNIIDVIRQDFSALASYSRSYFPELMKKEEFTGFKESLDNLKSFKGLFNKKNYIENLKTYGGGLIANARIEYGKIVSRDRLQSLEMEEGIEANPVVWSEIFAETSILSDSMGDDESKIRLILPKLKYLGRSLMSRGNPENFGDDFLQAYNYLQSKSGDISIKQLLILDPNFAPINDSIKKVVSDVKDYVLREMKEESKRSR